MARIPSARDSGVAPVAQHTRSGLARVPRPRKITRRTVRHAQARAAPRLSRTRKRIHRGEVVVLARVRRARDGGVVKGPRRARR